MMLNETHTDSLRSPAQIENETEIIGRPVLKLHRDMHEEISGVSEKKKQCKCEKGCQGIAMQLLRFKEVWAIEIVIQP